MMVALRRSGRRAPRGSVRCLSRIAALAGLTVGLAGAGARAELPPEDQCPTFQGIPGGGPAQDAAPVRIREGMMLGYEDVLLLRNLLPIEVWRNREAFFHDGMRLEVGPCHRRYPVPDFFARATRQFAGKARLDAEGNLHGHVAGLPFPPPSLDPEAPDLALRWAWNFERRYRGAGPTGTFRLVDMPSRFGGVQTYEGDWLFVQTSHRADLANRDYATPYGGDNNWIAGGRFREPTPARHLAWRQLRPRGTDTRYTLPDDTFVYVPTMRKVRRAATAWVDGLFTPRYRVAGDAGGGGIALGGGGGIGPAGAINPGAAESIAASENLRRGFEGLSLRPNAYQWRVLAEREVLAPINITRTGFPESKNRNFGPSGLSVGSDRWDVRYAVVIQGALKERGRDFDLITLYVDYQTQQPLFVVTKKRRGGRLAEVGILLHRFSGDLMKYPVWPTGGPAWVFDPVAAVFFDTADGGSGWRRESYDVVSTPQPDAQLERLASPGTLDRGR